MTAYMLSLANAHRRGHDVYYLWRPNLPDEADNHVVELAVAGGAEAVVTHNTRDFERAELHFPGLRVVTPGEMIAED